MSAFPWRFPVVPNPDVKEAREAIRAILPDYLPARMVNEYVYCPRLFFYEWVDGVFRENADTIEGAARRKRRCSGSSSAWWSASKRKSTPLPEGVVPIFGSRGRVSDVLSRRRAISKDQAKRLGERFQASPAAFI
ncbi:MAG TPA: hypothetical protein VNH18_09415 [Bryobacteraceae bacterium]|nr:hypothetical protein [Bryobacteraceae bacterium]